MADQQDNRTEQWLREYSRRRREQHGPAPQMHDATRRLLHGEIQRTWSQPAPATETSGGWETWLLKLATGTIAVGAMAVTAYMYLGNDRADNPPGTMEMTQAEPAQPAAERKESVASNESENVKKFEENQRGRDSIAAAPAEADKGLGVLKNKKMAKNAAVKSIAPRGLSARSAPHRSAPKVMSLGHRDPSPRFDSLSNMRRNFSQQAKRDKGVKLVEVRKDTEPATTQPVMQNFEVTRNGATIQVRDEDGSIYKGRVIFFANATPMMAAVTGPNAGKGGQIGGSTKPANPTKPGGGSGGGLPGIVNSPKKPAVPPVRPPQIGVGGLRPALPGAAPGQYNPAVPNDNVENPLVIPALGKPMLGHNLLATRQPGRENLYSNFHGRSVWYFFKAPDTGVATISTRGSNFDTTLGVFKGATPGTIEPMPDVNGQPAWNNDQPNAPWSKVRFQCVANGEYRVAVDGVSGATGQIKMIVRLEKATAPDEIAAARKVNTDKALFFFQVAGTNRVSGRPVQFEGFVRNAPAKAKVNVQARKDLSVKKRLAETEQLRIQGRASYGKQQLNVDAITASIAPVPASPVKSKALKK
jgi:hypothetical protein